MSLSASRSTSSKRAAFPWARSARSDVLGYFDQTLASRPGAAWGRVSLVAPPRSRRRHKTNWRGCQSIGGLLRNEANVAGPDIGPGGVNESLSAAARLAPLWTWSYFTSGQLVIVWTCAMTRDSGWTATIDIGTNCMGVSFGPTDGAGARFTDGRRPKRTSRELLPPLRPGGR